MNRTIAIISMTSIFAFQCAFATMELRISSSSNSLSCDQGIVTFGGSTFADSTYVDFTQYYISAYVSIQLSGFGKLEKSATGSNSIAVMNHQMLSSPTPGQSYSNTSNHRASLHPKSGATVLDPPPPVYDSAMKTCEVAPATPTDPDDKPCPGSTAAKRGLGNAGFQSLHNGECHPSPLLIDIDQKGFALGGPENLVAFDLFSTDQPLLIQWVQPHGGDAFLVRDLNGNGIVDNGLELFGNGSFLIGSENQRAVNGFTALGQFDTPSLGGNEDGYITEADLIWTDLQLWIDEDADGLSTPFEMWTLGDLGIAKLGVIPKAGNRHDPHGNWLPLWSWTYGDEETGHTKFKMADVYFKPHDDHGDDHDH